MATTLSANVKDALAVATRRMAEQENRTVSNVVENALLVFAELPKPLRDSLIDLRNSNAAMFQDLAHEMMAYIARTKLRSAVAEVAPYFKNAEDTPGLSDIEILEQSTQMSMGR